VRGAETVVATQGIFEAGALNEAYAAQVAELADRVLAKIGGFSFDLSRRLGRCNISHEPTMQTAFVNLRDGQVGGEKEWRVISPTEWICEEWRLSVVHSGNMLILAVTDLGVNVSVSQPLGSSAKHDFT